VALRRAARGSSRGGAATGVALRDEEQDLEGLLGAVRGATGLDFRCYARSTVRRRLRAVAARRSTDLAALCALALAHRDVLRDVVAALCVGVTSMFRDPEFFSAYRAQAVPLLRGRGPLRAWHAGCATGEELWSHAVVLEEEQLSARVVLYGTDLSPAALACAQRGVLPLDRMREYTAAYLRAGGRGEFSRYYAAGADIATVDDRLRGRAVFGRHDLTSDPPPGTFDVVFCRNVVIYFEPPLQERVHETLAAGLGAGGILALGRGEALPQRVRALYDDVDARNGIFRRRADVAA
jgi:chemotaxis protein methyltransferase CheR